LANKSSFVSVIIISLGVSFDSREQIRSRSTLSWLPRPWFWNYQKFLKTWF
jgi:hypothetical protein